MPAPNVGTMIHSWDDRKGVTAAMTLEAARRAEAVGLDALIVGDHVTFYGYGNDGLITLTAAATVTQRIQLKTSVYLLPLRHVVPVALQAAQLAQLSRGRLVFGIGVGGEDPHEFTSCGVDPHTRGARTNEALQVLRRLWTENDVSFQGEHFQLDAVSLDQKPPGPLPIFVGGRSDAALRRAGRYGDGYTGVWQSVERMQQAAALIDEAARAAGRPAGGVEMGMQFWAGVADDRGAARDLLARAMQGTYRIPFERFERYTPYGPAGEIAEFLASYVEAGARHVNLVLAQPTPEENIERAAEIRQALHALVA